MLNARQLKCIERWQIIALHCAYWKIEMLGISIFLFNIGFKFAIIRNRCSSDGYDDDQSIDYILRTWQINIFRLTKTTKTKWNPNAKRKIGHKNLNLITEDMEHRRHVKKYLCEVFFSLTRQPQRQQQQTKLEKNEKRILRTLCVVCSMCDSLLNDQFEIFYEY